MSKPVCLVIGGSGFMGRETVPVLSGSYEVVATSMRPRGGSFRTLDARDPDALSALIDEVRPDCTVMLAAYRDPDFCEDHPEETRRLNTEPCRILAERLPASARLVFVSTDYVFDGKHPPYGEEDTRCPVNVYGASKVEAEDIVLARPGSAVLRVPLLMGWTGDAAGSGFFSQLLNDLHHDGPLPLDDVLARYPVWTRDAGRAVLTLLEQGREGVYHFSTTRRLTRYRAALEMGALLGRATSHLVPSREVIPRRARRPDNANLSIAKWRSLGFPEPTGFTETAAAFIAHFGLA